MFDRLKIAIEKLCDIHRSRVIFNNYYDDFRNLTRFPRSFKSYGLFFSKHLKHD